jgi:hypothetical protein
VVGGGGADSMIQFRLERRDEVLSEDEADAVNSSWLHEKKA